MRGDFGSVLSYINTNGFLTVIGWYKRGTIKYKMLVSQNLGENAAGNNGNNMDAVQVDNGEVSFHFTQIVPTH